MDMEDRQISVLDKENQDNVTKQILKDIIQYSTPKTNKQKKDLNLQMGCILAYLRGKK